MKHKRSFNFKFCYQTCLFVSLTLRLLSRCIQLGSCQYQILLRCRTMAENRKQFQKSFDEWKKNFFEKFLKLKLISLISEDSKERIFYFFWKVPLFEAQKLSHHFTFFDGNFFDFWRTKKIFFYNIRKVEVQLCYRQCFGSKIISVGIFISTPFMQFKILCCKIG